MIPDRFKCECCGCSVPVVSGTSPRNWCQRCELEFQRVLCYLRTVAEMAAYVVRKAR